MKGRSIGMLLLGLYLILVGIAYFVPQVPAVLTAVVALLAGILILIGR